VFHEAHIYVTLGVVINQSIQSSIIPNRTNSQYLKCQICEVHSLEWQKFNTSSEGANKQLDTKKVQ
jgi:hypothetical protein